MRTKKGIKMKTLALSVTLATIALLTACSSQPDPLPEPQSEIEPLALDVSQTIDVQDYMLAGQIQVHPNGYSFTPCNSDNAFWLEFNAEQLQRLQQLQANNQSNYYAELIGQLNPTPNEGPSAAYLARFVVSDLNQVAPEIGNKCQQNPAQLRAFGTEPNWQVKMEKGVVSYRQWDNTQTQIAINHSQINNNRRIYRFDKGQLTLEKHDCQDQMSGALYQWQASFQLNGETLIGCATLAEQDLSASLVGTYQSEGRSASSPGLTTKLVIHADHSAHTEYNYQNGEDSIIETGFWQQANDKQLHVVMTQHQDKAVVAQRLFTIDGLSLTTHQEQINSQIYSLGSEGLTLHKMKTELTTVPTVQGDHQGPMPVLAPQNINARNDFDPKVDLAIRQYFKINRTDPTNNRYLWLTYDLNGDGQQELLAMMNWCGSGGCTLLIFKNDGDNWRFNSRITSVRGQIQLADYQHFGWRDLLIPVSRGGTQAALRSLQYTGVSYPLNASTAPQANTQPTGNQQNGNVMLFADNISPQQGIKM